MSNYTADSKSQLAKLMATENITVQHQKVTTAYFDTKNRTLVCPIWKDMSGELYDLLMGHEVGHALDTPAEGWHDAVVDNSKGRGYKGFLNVIEDARIEKRQKRRYPGLRRSFTKAYQELLDRDFFGIKGKNVNTLPFIDRLNLYTKGGVMLGIEFTDAEKVMLEKVEACETWSDVIRVTDEIYEYSKEEQQEIQQQMAIPDEDGDEYELEFTDDDGEEKDADPSDEDGEESDSKKASSSEKSDEETDEESDQETDTLNREKESNTPKEEFDPVCQTDEEFRKKETQLLDKKSKEYLYLELPKPNLDKIITPVNRVQELMTAYFANEFTQAEAKNYVNEFKTKNERYIGLLAKEFEMRKAAKSYAKKKVSETGDIDISKIYKYRLDDNIFRKMTTVPNGKSHGMMLLLDRSGSMQNNMDGSIEQILILALFCRKVNIPFAVYGFGNAYSSRKIDFPEEDGLVQCFENGIQKLQMNEVYLREYLNSRMPTKDFNQAVRNLILLRVCYTGNRYHGYYAPPSESLSNTPLNEALVAMKTVIEDFRKVNRVDIMNMIVVHDGDADANSRYFNSEDKLTYLSQRTQNIVFRDPKTKYEFEIDDPETYIGEQMKTGLLKMIRYTTGTRVFGFFICDSGTGGMRNAICNRYVKPDGKTLYDGLNDYEKYKLKQGDEVTALTKSLRDQKFLESYTPGYNMFYLIPGGKDLSIGSESLDVDENASIAKIKTAFQKHNKKRQTNRVLVSKFITNIATEKSA